MKNHHRAQHVVNVMPLGQGFNVQFPYKQYTISLAADGGDVACWIGDGEILHQEQGTTGESIRAVMEWIDRQEV